MSFPSRTMCEALDEIRKAYETRNFSYLLGLVEEIQTMGNRMEAALYDKSRLGRAKEEYDELKEKLKSKEKELKILESKIKRLKEDLPSKAEKKALKARAKNEAED